MKHRLRQLPAFALVGGLAALLAACPAPDSEPAADPTLDRPAAPAEERARVYEADLQELNGSGVTGTATFTLGDDDLEVRLMAHGLEADQRVMQHVHVNSSCGQAGGILVNLDNDLSHANESAPRGDHYPQADSEGMLTYEVSRSLDDLRDAVREHGGTEVEQLDLGNRVVNLHGENMQAIACGPLQEAMGAGTGTTGTGMEHPEPTGQQGQTGQTRGD